MLVTAALCLTAVTADRLNSDFLKGFDSGVTLRSNRRAINEFNCPKPRPDIEIIDKLDKLVMPMKMAATLGGQKKIADVVDHVQIFTDAMREMMGVFDSAYDGGDFCTGLIFGIDGANMLFDVAESLVDSAEAEENERGRNRD